MDQSGLHIALLTVSAGFGVLTYTFARALLQGDDPKPFRLKEWRSGPGIYQGAIGLGTGVVLAVLSFGSINGDAALKCKFLGVETWVPAVFKCIGYDVFANLEQAHISDLPANWEGEADDRLAMVPTRELSGANLRFARGYGAIFVKANLRAADLRGANLAGADLRKTFLSKADLQDASLFAANLQGAYLFQTDLRKANLRMAKLETAIGLTQQQLDEACGNTGTKLPSRMSIKPCPYHLFLEQHVKWLESGGQEGAKADLGNNNLRSLDLTDAILGVNFEGADLQGAIGGPTQGCSALLI